MRWQVPVISVALATAAFLSAVCAEPPQPQPEKSPDVKGFHRNVKKMGSGVGRKIVGNKKSIPKVKYPYSERSFASRSSDGGSLLRDKHETAFAGAATGGCPDDAATTNDPPANADGALPPPPPGP